MKPPNVSFMPSYRTVWFVIADAMRARVIAHRRKDFRLLGRDHAHILAEEIWPSAALFERDLISDRPGRSFESVGAMRHAYGSFDSHHDAEKERAARILADRLNEAYVQGAYDELVLVMPADMLGRIRTALRPKPLASVSRIHVKDVTRWPTARLMAALPQWGALTP